MDSGHNREIVLNGISGSPGICIGKAYLVGKEGVDVVKKYSIAESDLQKEVFRFKSAVRKAKEELKEIIENTPQALKEHIQILETHLVLFKDKMLYGRTIEAIESEKINAEWALKTVIAQVKTIFQDIEDPYLQSRSADISHVADRIMGNLMGAREVDIAAINKRVILIAPDLSPAQTSQIQLERVMGFVTDHGGTTSHTSIIARTLEIPCVLGLQNATSRIESDAIIIVDGLNGKVILNPEDSTLLEYEERKLRFEEHRATITRSSHLPAKTIDGRELRVMGNMELAEEIVSVRDHGGDGIGLYRTEFLYMSRNSFPLETELFEQYREVVELSPGPVTIRTLDINGDKAVSYTYTPDEANPALGQRAIRFCLQRKDVFKTQLRAILRAGAYGEAKVMFPMISCVEEVLEAKEVLAECVEELTAAGLPHDADIPVGIMIEVPSAVIVADSLAEEVDFFSIGTNDLVQYLLAIDRGNNQVAHLYNPLNPAVLRILKQLVDSANRAGIQVAMCGEMAGDAQHLPILLGLGIHELSMNPQSIPAVKNGIRHLEADECRKFLCDVIRERHTETISQRLKDQYGHLVAIDFAN